MNVTHLTNLLNGAQTDPTQPATKKIPAVKNVNPWEHLNELLDAGLLTAIVQTKKMRFAVRSFFPMENGWVECAVDEEDNVDDIHIVVRQTVSILIYVGKPPFTN